jgi:hypothetical protein
LSDWLLNATALILVLISGLNVGSEGAILGSTAGSPVLSDAAAESDAGLPVSASDAALAVSDRADIKRYWRRRYQLWSKYDDGVLLDDEGWYSVSPEAVALHTAIKFNGPIVLDGFCGYGSNAIQFALQGVAHRAVRHCFS